MSESIQVYRVKFTATGQGERHTLSRYHYGFDGNPVNKDELIMTLSGMVQRDYGFTPDKITIHKIQLTANYGETRN